MRHDDGDRRNEVIRGMVRHRSRHGDRGRNRYVVSIRLTGLGDRLISLGAAWLFARNTGRTLVADWRHGAYSTAGGSNLFALCFEPLPELAGVPFVGDDRLTGLDLPRPRHPALWNDEALLAAPERRPSSTLNADRDAAVAMILARADVPAPTVVFDACINGGLVATADSRTFLASLRPVPSIARKVAAFRKEYLRGGPMIGLHMRHGNGSPVGDHAPYWRSFQAAIDRCGQAVRVAREQIGWDMPVFLCTDSSAVESAIKATISGVISRRKSFRPPGAGELHIGRDSYLVRDDALVEMLLLAESSALIRYPPGSFFSFYAAMTRDWQGPCPEIVSDLGRPYDWEDPLAPALLI